MAHDDFSVRFWGVRGSIACAGPATVRYGGNTSCVEVHCGGRRLIFDAGTGIRELGNVIAAEPAADIDLFLTHTHIDHINGIPFFAPLFRDDITCRIWAGHLSEGWTARKAIEQLMQSPIFPVPVDIFHAQVEYLDFSAGETHDLGSGVLVRTVPLCHPNGATGYRVDYGGKSVCYLTDTEHTPGAPDEAILGLMAGADVVIYDSTYTDQEFDSHLGWGHSTWEEGVRLMNQVSSGTFVAFHHDPDHNDSIMDEIASDLEAARPGSLVAREGMVLSP